MQYLHCSLVLSFSLFSWLSTAQKHTNSLDPLFFQIFCFSALSSFFYFYLVQFFIVFIPVLSLSCGRCHCAHSTSLLLFLFLFVPQPLAWLIVFSVCWCIFQPNIIVIANLNIYLLTICSVMSVLLFIIDKIHAIQLPSISIPAPFLSLFFFLVYPNVLCWVNAHTHCNLWNFAVIWTCLCVCVCAAPKCLSKEF